MSEIRTSRTSNVSADAVDSASTINLAELFAGAISLVATGIGALITEARDAALLNETTPARSAAPTQGRQRPIVSIRVEPKAIANSTQRLSGHKNELPASIKAIASEAPFVSRANAPAFVKLAQEALRLPAGEGRNAAIANLRTKAAAEYQQVTFDTVLTRVTTSLSEMKFTPVSVKPATGYILARQGEDGPLIRLDLRKAANGIEIEADADGFSANSCQTALDQLEKKLSEKGIRLHEGFRRPKRNRYAAIRQAVRLR